MPGCHPPQQSKRNSILSASFWSIALTSTMVFLVGVGPVEAGSKKWISSNQSAYHPPKTFSKTPSRPSIDRSRLNRSLGSIRGGGTSRFSIDRSRLTTKKKKTKRSYRVRRRKSLPKAKRVVRVKKKIYKSASKAMRFAKGSRPEAPRNENLNENLLGKTMQPSAGLVLTLTPPEVTAAHGDAFSQLKDIREAIQLSEAVLDIANLRRPVHLPFGDPLEEDNTVDEQAGALNPFFKEGSFGSRNMRPGDQLSGAGPGWPGFGFIANSHSKPVPGTAPIGVTPARIRRAIGGVASNGDSDAPERTYTRVESGVIQKRVYQDGSVMHYKNINPGGNTPESTSDGVYRETTAVYNADRQLLGRTDTSARRADEPGERIIESTAVTFLGRQSITTTQTSRVARDGTRRIVARGTSVRNMVNERRNPDYVDGSGWLPHWCKGGAGCGQSTSTSAILRAMNRNARVLTPGPGQETAQPQHNGPPIVSQHDLLAKYDPESSQSLSRQGRSQHLRDGCFHSEC